MVRGGDYNGGLEQGVEDEFVLDLTPYVDELMPNYLHRLETNKSTKTIREAVESNHIRDALKSMLFESTKRRPLIIINVMEI